MSPASAYQLEMEEEEDETLSSSSGFSPLVGAYSTGGVLVTKKKKKEENMSARVGSLERQVAILVRSVEHLFVEMATLMEHKEELLQEMDEKNRHRLHQNVKEGESQVCYFCSITNKRIAKLADFFGEEAATMRQLLGSSLTIEHDEALAEHRGDETKEFGSTWTV
jgi:hypothetical protein